MTLQKRHQDRLYLIGAGFLTLIYVSVQAFFYLNALLTPDEDWFLGYMRAQHLAYMEDWRAILWQENYLGYGSLFWVIYSFIESPKGLKVLGLLQASFVFLSFYILSEKNYKKLFAAVAIWFFAPVSWFYAKIVGAELFALSMCALSVVFLFKSSLSLWGKWGWLILGMAIGIKLTCIPLAVFLVVERWNTALMKNWMARLKAFSLLLLGFFIFNPIIILNPLLFIRNITITVSTNKVFWERGLESALSSLSLTWDMLYYAGFVQACWSGLAILALGLFCYLNKLQRSVFLALLLASICMLFMLSRVYFVLIFYWIHYFLIFPLIVLQIRKPIKYMSVFFLAVGLQAYAAAPLLENIFTYRWQEMTFLDVRDSVKRCTYVNIKEKFLSTPEWRKEQNVILDLAAFSNSSNFQFLEQELSKDNIMEAQREYGYNAVLILNGEKTFPEQGTLIFLNSNLKNYKSTEDFPSYLEHSGIAKNRRIILISSCPPVDSYFVPALE